MGRLTLVPGGIQMREVPLRIPLIIAASIIQCNYRAPQSDSYSSLMWCSLHPARKANSHWSGAAKQWHQPCPPSWASSWQLLQSGEGYLEGAHEEGKGRKPWRRQGFGQWEGLLDLGNTTAVMTGDGGAGPRVVWGVATPAPEGRKSEPLIHGTWQGL